MIGDLEGFEIVIACVAQGPGFYLRVPSESARDWLNEVLEQNGARGLAVRAGAEDVVGEVGQARGPWLALSLGAGAIALFAWSLVS